MSSQNYSLSLGSFQTHIEFCQIRSVEVLEHFPFPHGGLNAQKCHVKVPLNAASVFERGAAPHAGSFCPPSLGFVLRTRLRRSKLAPGEFVFACPKTKLSGTILDARSAPEGFAPGSAQVQRNQKKGHLASALILRVSPGTGLQCSGALERD